MPRRKPQPKDRNDRLYVPGEQGGWHQKSGKYLDKSGRYTARAKALADDNTQQRQMGWVPAVISPTSKAFETIEVSLWDSDNHRVPDLPKELERYKTPNFMVAAARAVLEEQRIVMPKPNLMPTPMRARMLLSENFWNTDGDAAQVVDAPVDLLYKTPFIENASSDLRSEIEDMMREWNFDDILPELWRTMRIFGQSMPYELWDGGKLEQVIPLPPLYVHIGYNSSYALSAGMVGEEAWSTRILKTTMHPAMYQNVWWHWNYNAATTAGLKDSDGHPLTVDDVDTKELANGVAYLNRNDIKPIHDKKLAWYRYSMPMLSKGFRDLTDLYVYEDTVRALVEGTKYQMWVFLLGDKNGERPPLPQEVTALMNTLDGLSGERTGMLVWKNPLEIVLRMPEGLDKMIGNDYYSIKKKSFYRKMGITSMVVSGERPGAFASSGGGGGGQASDLDVRIYLEKSRFQANQVLNGWAKYLILKQLRARNKGNIKNAERISLRLPWSDMEMASMFKDVFGEAYRDGLIAEEQALRSMNLHYDDTVKAKRGAKADREDGLFTPPTTFIQQTVNPEGDTKTTGQTEPQGSPTQAGESRNAEGMTRSRKPTRRDIEREQEDEANED